MTKFKVGDIGIFNEYGSSDWLNYENARCEVVEFDEINSGLRLKFEDNFTLETDHKEFKKL